MHRSRPLHTYLCPAASVPLLFVCIMSLQALQAQTGFPDVIAGRQRTDSVSVLESSIGIKLPDESGLLTELGCRKVMHAQYQSAEGTIHLRYYDMHTMLGAFGYFSICCGSRKFAGSIGNAALHADTLLVLNVGNYHVEMQQVDGSRKQPPPDFVNGVYDHLSTVAVYEMMTTPLPMDEIDRGTERFYGGPLGWKTFPHPSIAFLHSILAGTRGFSATYVKSRLNISRTGLAIQPPPGSSLDSLRRILSAAMERKGIAGRTGGDVAEYVIDNTRWFIAPLQNCLLLAGAGMDDPGVRIWLEEMTASSH